VADVRLFDVGQADGFDNSEIRTSRARMSAGNSANSASTVSSNVSTVHAIAIQYTRCGIDRRRHEGDVPLRPSKDVVVLPFELEKHVLWAARRPSLISSWG
jgi:hypothetical protein